MGSKRAVLEADSELGAGPSMHDFAARLAQHGEAFMQMFDKPDKASINASKRAKISEPVAKLMSPVGTQNNTQSPVTVSAQPKVGTDALADIWSDGRQGRKKRFREQPTSMQSSPAQPSVLDASAMKAEHRRFMSGRASDVHRIATPSQAQRQQSGQAASNGPSRDDFLTMQREVQTFAAPAVCRRKVEPASIKLIDAEGAEALDKKQRKQFDAWQLQNVKAVPQKPGRVSAAIGKGIAKKQAERQQKAKEEAIASGMLTLKGSGKQKRRSDVDKGLSEDGGLFKGGMLRVKGAVGSLANKKKKGSTSHKRAFSSSKIGNLDGNSQKAWNVAKTQNKKMKGPAGKKR